ncbi:MAG: polysaccharide pyruvyl transferase family protein [Bacilli bacterium]|mgnify:CR=1 FL=1|nr:polysaccharide pyruvyl transferase family protein [Bacilli bacterium]
MKKVYLKAYLKRNLGDDLFLKILCERYNCSFIINNNPRIKYKGFCNNLTSNNSLIIYSIYKLLSMFFQDYNFLEKRIARKCDLMVTIGGSIFIENSAQSQEQLKRICDIYNLKIDKLILGANFGPYKTKEFKQVIEQKIFNNCIDISFRDNYSYKLFSSLANVRSNPDIIFSLNINKLTLKNEKKVVISVINCKNRDIDSKMYENKIVELIKYFDSEEYETVLMSFCQYEGDEEAIENIFDKIKYEKFKKNISKYFYRNDIDQALEVLAKSSIIVGSRFHANILGLKMKKIIVPIAYSDKTVNALNDLGYKGKIYDARNLNCFVLNDEFKKNLKYKCDVSNVVFESEKHFEKLDSILPRRRKNGK